MLVVPYSLRPFRGMQEITKR
uniref:Uncharacterized protein n=1 Tax=Arundo donax TaxID=35708 RepID=A0A0A8YAY1_ARUDO